MNEVNIILTKGQVVTFIDALSHLGFIGAFALALTTSPTVFIGSTFVAFSEPPVQAWGLIIAGWMISLTLIGFSIYPFIVMFRNKKQKTT